MKKINKFLLLLVISSTLFVSCEKEEGPSSELVTLSFEELSPGNEGYWNGADGSGEIKSGELIMTNNYTNGDHPSWDGFSYSNLYDTETAGFGNQYSVFNEVNGENNFLVFTPSYTEDVFATFEDGAEYGIKSIKLCNNTYAALSMKNGDVFGKKFGGDSGEEEDWFKVTISGYDAAGDLQGEVDFYLADFRESGVANDYIIEEWTEVDLSSLGEVNKITLSFNSSDVGNYGVNTPKYVCVDDIIYEVIADL
jgi:hypothetical protein